MPAKSLHDSGVFYLDVDFAKPEKVDEVRDMILADSKKFCESLYLRDNNEDLNLANKIINGGKKTWGSIDFKAEANSFNSSSHQSFWDQGLKAVVLTQNWENDLNPRWHTPNDFAETLNLSTWTQSFKFITGSVLAICFNIEK